MISTPFSIFISNLTWSPIPSSVSLTIGSQSAQGGAGILGYGEVADVCAYVGPSSIGVNDPVPVAQILQNAVVGSPYSEELSAQGGASSYAFSISSGALPDGLSLNGSTGEISGTPSSAGTVSFTIEVVDANGNVGTQEFTIIVSAPSSAGEVSYVVI